MPRSRVRATAKRAGALTKTMLHLTPGRGPPVSKFPRDYLSFRSRLASSPWAYRQRDARRRCSASGTSSSESSAAAITEVESLCA